MSDKDAHLANVALLYYGEGLTQSEIAQRLGVSRPTIVNLLRESRERGIVEIRVEGEVLAASNLSRLLCQKFNLKDAYVSQSRGESAPPADRAEALAQVARVAAMALIDIVKPGDSIGVAWGETIKAVSSVIGNARIDGVTVCQMIGSMVSDRVPASEDCAIRIANCFGATCFTLHAPAVLSSAELANALKIEPTIAAQLKRFDNLDVAVFSVGNMAASTHLAGAGIAQASDIETAEASGARGVVCCRYIDAQGNALQQPPQERIVAIEVDQLRRIERKLLVVAGEDRKDAALAVLNGGLATHLCVDEALAHALLEAG
ncbi:sugar-binding transcriptional regulator [Oricola sp.]|uniref:sugar-binding transcriptional regulator n=1 Tax=Oricola sp. TaxID=1979950 RepID=UPI003BA87CFB